jgi:glycosyltransferase involved in cell wall biosynthesis
MRILIVTGCMPPAPCGVGDYSLELARSLARLEDVEVSMISRATDAEAGPVRVFPVRDWSIGAIPAIWRALRMVRPHVVHVQYPSRGYEGRIASKLVSLLAALRGAKVVQTWHEWWRLSQFPDLLVKSVAASGVIFVRHNYLDRFDRRLAWALRGKRLEFIPNASTIPRSLLAGSELQAVRASYAGALPRLSVFFGLMSAAKAPDLLFDICDPARDALVFVGAFSNAEMENLMRSRAREWGGRVTFAGHVGGVDAADVLAAADAVILPFREGAGTWNSSLHAATEQGTFVLTTHAGAPSYDADTNVARVDASDLPAMRASLDEHAGRKRPGVAAGGAWVDIARRHRDFYSRLLPVDGARAEAAGR